SGVVATLPLRECIISLIILTAWRSLSCPRSELRLDLTLGCGQTFR
uniref:Uncharacterized protein n=1 Tax=Sinocyclocheilus anshuiensis TaxID=1608454 RepID=A0A671R2X8_9TELE